MLISKNLHKKSSEVSIKTRSTPASLSFIGQVTKQTTVKWTICRLSVHTWLSTRGRLLEAWLVWRSIKTYRFPWFLILVSANHALSCVNLNFRYREDICLQTLLYFWFKCVNHRKKRPFVSTTNEALVGTLIASGDVNGIFHIGTICLTIWTLLLLTQTNLNNFEGLSFYRRINSSTPFYLTAMAWYVGGAVASWLVRSTPATGPSSGAGRGGRCVVFLGKTFYSHGASLYPGV